MQLHKRCSNQKEILIETGAGDVPRGREIAALLHFATYGALSLFKA
jgi:hypothetical protein